MVLEHHSHTLFVPAELSSNESVQFAIVVQILSCKFNTHVKGQLQCEILYCKQQESYGVKIHIEIYNLFIAV